MRVDRTHIRLVLVSIYTVLGFHSFNSHAQETYLTDMFVYGGTQCHVRNPHSEEARWVKTIGPSLVNKHEYNSFTVSCPIITRFKRDSRIYPGDGGHPPVIIGATIQFQDHPDVEAVRTYKCQFLRGDDVVETVINDPVVPAHNRVFYEYAETSFPGGLFSPLTAVCDLQASSAIHSVTVSIEE